VSPANEPVRVGVVGCGYWGPNLIRNFYQLSNSRVARVADLDEKRLARIGELYPSVETTQRFENLLEDPKIDAIVIATPVDQHGRMGVQALEAGKHVLVEKPMARTAAECRAMIAAAEKHDRKVMVGHVFEFTAPVRKMKEMVDEGVLGQLFYYNSQRLNLGLFRPDVNVIWDLAPHDFSILMHLLDGKVPQAVRATAASHFNPQCEDVATVTLDFDDNFVAFIQVSWLDPRKVRQTTLVGSDKMLVYDDLEPTEKIWLYDRGVDVPETYDTFAEFPFTYRYGDITIPRISGTEPLRAEAQHFIECIQQNKTPLTDGHSGLRVVQILEATDASLKAGGARVEITS
jgi:predicted dehydrogenase